MKPEVIAYNLGGAHKYPVVLFVEDPKVLIAEVRQKSESGHRAD